MENSKNLKQLYRLQTQDEYNSMSHPLADQLRDIGMSLDVPESLPISLNNNYIHRQDYRYDFIFNNPNVHSIVYNGAQYWLAKDIARELGYDRTDNMVARNVKSENSITLSLDDITSALQFVGQTISDLGLSPHTRNAIFINEQGIYDCLDHSRISPKAEEFRNWSNSEVRPSIRQTGGYIDNSLQQQLMQNPEYIKNVIDQNRELMKNNNKLNNQINTLQNQISENERYTNLGKACYSSSDNITLNLLCKIIQNVLPFNFGLHALMEHLKFDGFLMRQPVNNNIISQKSLNMGLMTMIYDDNNVSYYPMVTPKGINFFINYFLKKFKLQENI